MKRITVTLDLDATLPSGAERILSNADWQSVFDTIAVATRNGRIDGPLWDQFGDQIGTFAMAEGEADEN